MPPFVFCGTFFETPEHSTLRVAKDALIAVGEDGIITQVFLKKDNPEKYKQLREVASAEGRLVELSKGQYLMPGLVDLHIHAPQWPQCGKALDLPLYEWLHKRTFPLEQKYKDLDFADSVYRSLVQHLLSNGTTTAVYFASIHVESSVHLAKICTELGQRAIVGRVAMDLADQCPSYYRDESPQDSIKKTENFISQVRAISTAENPLVLPSVVPRFIPTSSTDALKGLGELAKKYGCHIQTHCSESDWEHEHALERFGKSDAVSLDQFSLLTPKTVLAHCVFLSETDMELLREKGSAVAHCPLSNIYFSDAVFPLKHAMDAGVPVGLGTDISGGRSPSLLESCRSAVSSSHSLTKGVDPSSKSDQRGSSSDSRIDHIEAFWLGTASAGKCLKLPIGLLSPGYYFDAIVVDINAKHSNIAYFEKEDTDADVFQKIIFNGGPESIVQTWVSGKLVHSH